MKVADESLPCTATQGNQTTAPMVSWVEDVKGISPKPISALKVVMAIRNGRHKEKVSAIRALYKQILEETHGDHTAAKREVDALKKNLVAILFSGVFKARGDSNLVEYSHLLTADVDTISSEVRQSTMEAVKDDPHVFAAFTSPTGTGLKIIFRVGGDAAHHYENFLAVKTHVFAAYGLAVDESCKNVERLCFISWDRDAYLNPEAVPLAPVAQEAKPAPAPVPVSGPVDSSVRQSIAAELLGAIDWQSGTRGYCTCPGEHLHSTSNGERDCEVHLDGVPSVNCFHDHCAGIVAGVNHELRSRVAKAESSKPTPYGRGSGAAAEYLPGEVEQDEEEPQAATSAWPAPIAPEAFYGLAGDVVRTLDPHTEADPGAVLVMFLAAFGNLLGPTAYFMAEARKHYARIWPVLVGETAKGRKGSAWSSLRYLLEMVEEAWIKASVGSGLSSGEGLIWCVRDPIVRHRKAKDGAVEELVEDEGALDKRLLTVEEEFSSVLKVASRDGCTISDTLRRAWDTGELRTMTKNTALRASGAHVTVVGHITRSDLSRLLAEGDALNGFGNRFIWCAVRRSKLLPEGGALHEAHLAPLVLRLRKAVDFARTLSLVKRSPDAKKFWGDIYPVLTADRAGLLGAITNRAESQTMRMALIYALLDNSPQIEVPHLRAALAVWKFCDDSARFIFGEALGDKVADRILDELRCAGARGLTRNEIREVFKRNLSTAKAEAALGLLDRLHLAHWSKEPRQGAGRPAIVWRATKRNISPASSPALPPVEQPAEPAEPARPEPEPELEPVAVTDAERL